MWTYPTIEHGKQTKYGYVVYYPDNFELGKYADIGWGCFIQAQYGVFVGKNVKIGGGCYIYSADTSRGVYGPVYIGEGCRIGAQCTILPNVILRDGARIPAHSLVFKNKKGEIIVRKPEKKDYSRRK
jgi:acetyltransferase-like isoleucine patch superfamily enzyme